MTTYNQYVASMFPEYHLYISKSAIKAKDKLKMSFTFNLLRNTLNIKNPKINLFQSTVYF